MDRQELVDIQAEDRLEEDHQQEDHSAHQAEAAMAAAPVVVAAEESWGGINPQNSMVIALRR